MAKARHKDLKEVINRIMNDAAFREKFLVSPEEALVGAGYHLTPEQLQKLCAKRDQLIEQFGEELDKRISKVESLS